MATQIDTAIFNFVLATGGTSPQQIEQWAAQSGMDPQSVITSVRGMLATGIIYYKVRGVIVANPKKAAKFGITQSAAPQQQVQQQAQPQGRPNPFGGRSNYRPPGVGRLRI